MNVQTAELSSVDGYVLSVNTEDTTQNKIRDQLVEHENAANNNEKINSNTKHVEQFISMLNDSSQSCIDQMFFIRSILFLCQRIPVRCKISLWIGVHFWFIVLIIGNAVDIHKLVMLINILNVNCPEDIYEWQNNYDDCEEQIRLKKIGHIYALIVIYGLIVFSAINILINCVSLYGIYKCMPLIILLQFVIILLQCVIDVSVFVYTWYFYYGVCILLRLIAARIYFRVYKWSMYYKSGKYLNPMEPYPE